MNKWFMKLCMLPVLLAALVPAAQALTEEDVTLKVDELESHYQLTVPVSQLFMRVPKDNFKQTRNFGVSVDNPRYFYFLDQQKGTVISGWFESAKGYNGFEKRWNAEKAAWKRSQLPEPQHETLFNTDGWEGVSYEIAVPQHMGNNVHVRAYYVYAGTWIDLHLSMTAKADVVNMRAALMQLLKRIEVLQRP